MKNIVTIIQHLSYLETTYRTYRNSFDDYCNDPSEYNKEVMEADYDVYNDAHEKLYELQKEGEN